MGYREDVAKAREKALTAVSQSENLNAAYGALVPLVDAAERHFGVSRANSWDIVLAGFRKVISVEEGESYPEPWSVS